MRHRCCQHLLVLAFVLRLLIGYDMADVPDKNHGCLFLFEFHLNSADLRKYSLRLSSSLSIVSIKVNLIEPFL